VTDHLRPAAASAKSAVRPYYEVARRVALTSVHAVRRCWTTRTLVAHHGIQRSGTNYLRTLLDDSGFFVVNGVDPTRDDPRHKHFRWQDDKSTIVMDRAFRNRLHVRGILHLNELTGLAPDVRHVVVFKTPDAWLTSIGRWGRVHGWTDLDDVRCDPEVAAAWLREWDAYHAKWIELQSREPERVLLVCYDDLATETLPTLRDVCAFLGDASAARAPAGGLVRKVSHSSPRDHSDPPASRQLVVSPLVDATVTCNWRAHVRAR
jgi:hypothetical protein